ncbi:MAG: tRNA guanosine(34) transglycosylase Tgt [Coriobacteriales bacterium]|jgi:queuine tRNA-ribosyltransferase|nr:tRNA guanosine(34) transglycosylase Tgt [Coriobacteriales bacterium]
MTVFDFQIQASDPLCAARAGVFTTPHGELRTPVFMPVGTKATVKAMTPEQLRHLGAQILLANTYHLFLRPGDELIREAGGLHAFMNWDRPLLTDSGGFQVFSLADTLKLSDDGVGFASIVDGQRFHWTPEDNVAVQNHIGADIIMQLDQCTPYPCETATLHQAVVRSAEWARRCRVAHQRPDQALFAIVQGGTDLTERLQSVQRLLEIDSQTAGFPGFGIGGYSVGEPHQLMFETLPAVAQALPVDRPRYLMGVGNPTTLLRAVACGVDMFDCVLPTRTARTGTVFSHQGRMNLRNARYKNDFQPLDDSCDCPTCQGFSRAYLHHLVMAREMLASVALTQHNLRFLLRLMEDCRQAICTGRFGQLLAQWENSAAVDDF